MPENGKDNIEVIECPAEDPYLLQVFIDHQEYKAKYTYVSHFLRCSHLEITGQPVIPSLEKPAGTKGDQKGAKEIGGDSENKRDGV